MVKTAVGRYEVSSVEELGADIRDANMTPEDDVITIKNNIVLSSSLPNISSNISFLGSINSDNPNDIISISGTNTQRSIFIIRSGEVSFSNLDLINGSDIGSSDLPPDVIGATNAYGGALRISGGNVIANHVDFINNLAQGGSISAPVSRAADGFGGSVYIGNGSSFTVSNSSFIGNRAKGGQATADPPGSLTNGIGLGGAIYVDTGGSLNFIDRQSVKFENNTITSDRNGLGTRPNDIFPETTNDKRRPVLIIPGILGSFFNNQTSSFQEWSLNRGLTPDKLTIDPILHSYDDLIATLETDGYKLGEDLFTVPYDWRLDLAPTDGNDDGNLTGLSATNLVDGKFDYGVDYLGVVLKQAADKWQERYGTTLDSVDVVAHSMGGLVARSYIQSDAYGASVDGDGTKLPTVNNLITLGTPNAGAPKAWNPINDDWNSDPLYQIALSKLVNYPYQKVLKGEAINGPTTINRDTITINQNPESPDSKKGFIEQYSPSLKALIPTYDFGIGIQGENKLLLDLNAKPDETASRSNVTIIYESKLPTITRVEERTGPEKTGAFIGVGDVYEKSLASFTDFLDHVPANTDTWWKEFSELNGDSTLPDGDGTVPVESATFIDGKKVPLNYEDGVGHTELPSDPRVQGKVLEILGADPVTPSTGLNLSDLVYYGSLLLNPIPTLATDSNPAIRGTISSLILDPVDGFLTDAQGRRLGYSQETGAVTEIPNSVWFGDSNGIGWILGGLSSPATLQLTGLGEGYYVQVSGQQDGQELGAEASGNILAKGESRNLDITLGATTSGAGTDMIISGVGQDSVLGNGHNDRLNYTNICDSSSYLW